MTPDMHLEIRTNTGGVLGIELKSSLNGIGEDCRRSEVTLQKEIPPHDGAFSRSKITRTSGPLSGIPGRFAHPFKKAKKRSQARDKLK
jgi:hypothetical protein